MFNCETFFRNYKQVIIQKLFEIVQIMKEFKSHVSVVVLFYLQLGMCDWLKRHVVKFVLSNKFIRVFVIMNS